MPNQVSHHSGFLRRRLSCSDSLLVATHNRGKLAEFQALLAGRVADVIGAGDLGLAAPAETGVTFAENAALKAKAAAVAAGMIALADDSGFCLAALNGEPGLHSARLAEEKGGIAAAMRHLHQRVGDKKDRSASFVCVLALAWPDGHVETVEGRIGGTFVWPPQGEGGHGYDPVFMPAGHQQTFAEMSQAEKNRISHRGLAFQALLRDCFAS
jgi:XTP/dITP diphosphohydrolase